MSFGSLRSFAAVRTKLRHLIVDEYQDINPAQEALIELLARPPVELCVVGDDDQSIYQWRGSDVNNIVTFRSRYPKVAHFGISVNRRSRPTIISTANSFAKTIVGRIEKTMEHYRPAAGPEVVTGEHRQRQKSRHYRANHQRRSDKGVPIPRYRCLGALLDIVRSPAQGARTAWRSRAAGRSNGVVSRGRRPAFWSHVRLSGRPNLARDGAFLRVGS